MDATKVLAQESENPANGSGFKPEENRVTVVDGQNDCYVPPAADSTVVTNRFDGTETGLELISESNCRLGVMDKEKDDGSFSVEKINNGGSFFLNNVVSESEKSKGNELGRLYLNGKGRWNGETLEDGNHGFKVGDFVWCKIKSHPWWPGQVYDPRDASEFAIKHSQEGRILVAFFGDGSCSWCLPSQLVPFIENFKEMSLDGSSKGFQNAIQQAVDVIRRLVESKMICKCVSLEKRDHLARPMASNAGVKAGIRVPEVDVNQLLIPEYEPDEVLSKVVDMARGVCVDDVFELGVLRSWLSAFNYSRCGYPLAACGEPLHIEGLEDKDENKTVITYHFSRPIEAPIQGPMDEVLASFLSVRSPDRKIYYRRKKKSVAELMEKDDNGKPNSKKRAALKEGKDDARLGRKRRVEGSESDNITKGKPKKIEVAVGQDASFEANEEMEPLTSPRERKKSKYLSPPYTNFSSKKVNSVSKTESESDKKTTKAPSPASELDDETSDDEMLINQLTKQPKFSFSASDVDVGVNEVLSEVESAAVDPLHLRKKGSLDKVSGFTSAFRSSTYSEGLDHNVYQKGKRAVRKRKSLPSIMANQEKENEQELDNKKPQKGSRLRAGLRSGRLAPTDDLVSDVSVMKLKLDAMIALLKNHGSKFSTKEKVSLKDEMKRVMKNVETAKEKVRVMAENASS